MFLGEYTPNITSGARLALPKGIRDQVRGEEVILSRGFEKCIFGYSKEEWEAESFKYADAPISDSAARHLKRYMFSGAAEVALDGQGRFVIPKQLKKYAGVSGAVVVIGAGDHFEIWDEKTWGEYLKGIEGEAANLPVGDAGV